MSHFDAFFFFVCADDYTVIFEVLLLLVLRGNQSVSLNQLQKQLLLPLLHG